MMSSPSELIVRLSPGRRVRALLGVASILFSAGATVAHHAPFIYDTETVQTVTGIVVSFQWEAPHTWTTVKTLGARGEAVVWSLEGMHPQYLGRSE